jgi:hypothetical protein
MSFIINPSFIGLRRTKNEWNETAGTGKIPKGQGGREK